MPQTELFAIAGGGGLAFVDVTMGELPNKPGVPWSVEVLLRADLFSSVVRYYDYRTQREEEVRDPAFRLNNEALESSLRAFEQLSGLELKTWYSEAEVKLDKYGLP